MVLKINDYSSTDQLLDPLSQVRDPEGDFAMQLHQRKHDRAEVADENLIR
jgi:hypothetical protein